MKRPLHVLARVTDTSSPAHMANAGHETKLLDRLRRRFENYSAWFHMFIGVSCLSMAALLARFLCKTPQSREDVLADLKLLGLVRQSD